MSSNRFSTRAIWGLVLVALAVPLVLATQSPYLAWRQPVYIIAGFAGILGFGLMVLQPLVAARVLPTASPDRARRWHRRIGIFVLAAIVLHIVGLWVTSPPDVVDVLLFRSPTPFSIWGALAMWAIVLAAGVALLRGTLGLGWRRTRQVHAGLTALAVLGTILHVLLIDGTMEPWSKLALCAAALGATLWAVIKLRLWH